MNAKNISEILDALATRLSGPAAHVWGVMVRQSIIQFWEMLLSTVILIVLTGIGGWLLTKLVKVEDVDIDMIAVFGCIITAILAVATIIMMIVTACNLDLLLNPEYNAITTLLGAVKH